MGITSPNDTLSYHRARPLCLTRDGTQALVPAVIKRIHQTVEGGPLVMVEQAAAEFYLLNHAMALVGQRCMTDEPLGDFESLARLYHARAVPLAVRMFSYLAIICTCEARHFKTLDTAAGSAMYGLPQLAFLKHIRQWDKSNREPVVQYLFTNPPLARFGSFVDSLVWVFETGGWEPGSSYGGPKWAVIARLLQSFVHGKISPEQMLDTAFSLVHNGGPIFNKGYLFKAGGPNLMRVLDAQAAGQVPALVHEERLRFKPPVLEAWEKCHALLGEVVAGPVDWAAVDKAATSGLSYAGLAKVHLPGDFAVDPKTKVAKAPRPKKAVVLTYHDDVVQASSKVPEECPF